MSGTRDPRTPHARRLRLLSPAARPLPTVVPLLRPDQAITPAQDALLTGIARRARDGDLAARDLLWRAFAAMLEPTLLRCGRMAWRPGWARRDGRPWELDDLRQEAWLVFAELAAGWPGEGSFIPYVTAYFPWRLRNALRRLGPVRLPIAHGAVTEPVADDPALADAEVGAILAALAVALNATDAEVLRLRMAEGAGFGEIAARLKVSRKTVARRWLRIRRVAGGTVSDPSGLEQCGR